MPELEPTWPRVIAIWWLILWRTWLGGLVIGLTIGLIVGFAGILAGNRMAELRVVISVVAGCASFAWVVIVTRMALRKQYKGFRIALIATGRGRA